MSPLRIRDYIQTIMKVMTLFPCWNFYNAYGSIADPITNNKKHSSQPYTIRWQRTLAASSQPRQLLKLSKTLARQPSQNTDNRGQTPPGVSTLLRLVHKDSGWLLSRVYKPVPTLAKPLSSWSNWYCYFVSRSWSRPHLRMRTSRARWRA
jgi:hypothetical protein